MSVSTELFGTGTAISVAAADQRAATAQRAAALGHPAVAHGRRTAAHRRRAMHGRRTATYGRSAAVTRHAAAMTARQQARVRRYWTALRMRHAAPLRLRTATVRSRRAPRRSRMSARLTSTPQTATPMVGEPLIGRLASTPQTGATQATGPLLGGALAILPSVAQLGQSGSQTAAPTTAGQAWPGGGAVARTTGKVFFTMSGHDYVCSGSAVASRHLDVVMTAGHCVKDGTGAWATNWTFVPGYANGQDPYGSYTARRFFVAGPWSTKADNDYDVAFVTVNPARAHGTKVALGREVGGQPIAFGSQPAEEIAFGYPSDQPYDGQQLYYCGGSTSPDPYHLTGDTGLYCALTAGTSGGPWLSGFDQATGTGTITSVSSFKYSNDDLTLYGPELGSSARALYHAAQAS
ncbi:MAG TPA: trypsin-like serine protease [Streptosporangiaceae bacterium]